MAESMDDILHPKTGAQGDPGFPDAPEGWTQKAAMDRAQQEGIELTEDHWVALRALHEYFSRHADSNINVRELHDALDERFHPKGGIKYLYKLFPGGPVAQGCRLAGLQAPAGSQDPGFGSVQ